MLIFGCGHDDVEDSLFIADGTVQCINNGHNYYYYNRFMALCPGLPLYPCDPVREETTYPLTYPNNRPNFIIFFHLL